MSLTPEQEANWQSILTDVMPGKTDGEIQALIVSLLSAGFLNASKKLVPIFAEEVELTGEYLVSSNKPEDCVACVVQSTVGDARYVYGNPVVINPTTGFILYEGSTLSFEETEINSLRFVKDSASVSCKLQIAWFREEV